MKEKLTTALAKIDWGKTSTISMILGLVFGAVAEIAGHFDTRKESAKIAAETANKTLSAMMEVSEE